MTDHRLSTDDFVTPDKRDDHSHELHPDATHPDATHPDAERADVAPEEGHEEGHLDQHRPVGTTDQDAVFDEPSDFERRRDDETAGHTGGIAAADRTGTEHPGTEHLGIEHSDADHLSTGHSGTDHSGTDHLGADPSATDQAAPGQVDAAHGARTDDEPLFAADEADDLQTRWRALQTDFVDDPQDAVQRADELVAQVIGSLANTFAEHRRSLEEQWKQEGHADTEELRVALRRYRTFFDRLLSV